MSVRRYFVRYALACVTLSLLACGGNPGREPATLSVSVAELALAARNPAALPTPIPGNPRVLTVTNTSSITAQAVAVDPSVVLPAGTTVTSNCGELAPGGRCTVTLTPGTVATTAPIALTIRGRNTDTVAPVVQVLAYGSAYQGGYVFALDDTMPHTGSVGGAVAAKRDLAVYVPWSINSDAIAGVDERSTAPCNGATDGTCNTQTILAHYGASNINPLLYAAGQCSAFSDEGYGDWYLPAVCEMGVDENNSSSGCGSRAAPRQQNVFTNLVDKGDIGRMVGSVYWTSTNSNAAPLADAWAQYFPLAGPGTQSFHVPFDRDGTNLMQRCVRAITP